MGIIITSVCRHTDNVMNLFPVDMIKQGFIGYINVTVNDRCK